MNMVKSDKFAKNVKEVPFVNMEYQDHIANHAKEVRYVSITVKNRYAKIVKGALSVIFVSKALSNDSNHIVVHDIII